MRLTTLCKLELGQYDAPRGLSRKIPYLDKVNLAEDRHQHSRGGFFFYLFVGFPGNGYSSFRKFHFMQSLKCRSKFL